MKLSKEVKTGILTLSSILLFIYGYSYIKGSDIFDSSRIFYVSYQNVEGLDNSARVTINGLAVGKVKSINLVNKEGGLIVSFSVDREFNFSRNSIVRIYSSSLIGGKQLAIILDNETNNIAKSGDTLKGEIEKGMLEVMTGGLKPLEQKVLTTLSNLDSLVLNLTDVLDDETRLNLKESIVNLNQTMNSFKEASGNLNSLIKTNKEKLNNTFANLEIASENFAKLSDSLAQIETGKMVKDLENIISRFNSILEGIENGEGSIGKLLKDDKLYDNLEGASKQLELLLEDMKLHPKRYVHFSLFGKKSKEYVKPEDTNN
ncbi:MAG: MCE family protein [Bacteroidetes bacterium]|nr:MCE family protein [Bacteroidota bacterium]